LHCGPSVHRLQRALSTHVCHPAPALPTESDLRALYQRFFEKIQVDQEWVTEVRQLASQGTVVYILRNLNFVDFFALDHLTKQFELPRIRFANDLGLWVLNPMGKGWLNAIMPRPRTPAAELTDALSLGGSAVLFLKRPPSVLDVAAGASGGRGLKGDELVQALIALQRERPISRSCSSHSCFCGRGCRIRAARACWTWCSGRASGRARCAPSASFCTTTGMWS
jgi:hypothetical protein